MADIVTPSQFQPQRAAAPTTSAAAAPAAQPPKAADPIAEAKALRDEAQTKLDAAEKRARTHAVEQRKFAMEKSGLGAKLSRLAEVEKTLAERDRLDAQAKLNKSAFLKAKFGDDWYEQVTQERLNGGAPTAETVALAIEQAQEKLRKELADQAEGARKASEQAATKQLDDARASLQQEATTFLETSAKEYPIFDGIAPTAVAQAIAQHIEGEFNRTGKVLTTKEAADALEAHEVSRAERLAGLDKYRERLTAKLKPALTVPAGQGVPESGSRSSGSSRRTLSNDLTASTPGQKRQPRNDEERRAAAFAAVDALKQQAP